MDRLISQKSRSNKPTLDRLKPSCLSGGVKKHPITMRPGYGKPVQGREDTEGYLGTEDLRPETELISDPICFTGQAFEQHINWDDRDKAV